MHASGNGVEALRFGFDAEHLYLRLDLAPEVLEQAADLRVDLVVSGRSEDRRPLLPPLAPAESALSRVLEMKVPFACLGLDPGEEAGFRLEIAGPLAARVPWVGLARFTVPHPHFEEEMWSV